MQVYLEYGQFISVLDVCLGNNTPTPFSRLRTWGVKWNNDYETIAMDIYIYHPLGDWRIC